MAFINKDILEEIDETGVIVFFVSRDVTKWYNAQRKNIKKRKVRRRQIALLGGWYWTLDRTESGPFRSPSAAMRDFYYRRMLRRAPPNLSPADVEAAKLEIAKQPVANKPLRRAA